MFDFRLRVFHTVCKRLSFTRAAEELFITQPAVTKHIREIEQHFKVKLLDRNGTKIKLTAAGKILFDYTEEIFSIYGSIETDLAALHQAHKGELRIGASTTVAQYVLPPVLASFHERYKEIKVSLTINNTEQIEQALQEKQIDLGIIEGRSRKSVLSYTEFIKDEIVLVASINNSLLKKPAITINELKKIPLLLREPGSGTLEVLMHALKPHGIKLSQLQREMQLGSSESMKLYLLNSNSMAFLSIYSVLKELANKECRIVDIKGLNIERFFYFIQPKGQPGILTDLFMKHASRHNFR